MCMQRVTVIKICTHLACSTGSPSTSVLISNPARNVARMLKNGPTHRGMARAGRRTDSISLLDVGSRVSAEHCACETRKTYVFFSNLRCDWLVGDVRAALCDLGSICWSLVGGGLLARRGSLEVRPSGKSPLRSLSDGDGEVASSFPEVVVAELSRGRRIRSLPLCRDLRLPKDEPCVDVSPLPPSRPELPCLLGRLECI